MSIRNDVEVMVWGNCYVYLGSLEVKDDGFARGLDHVGAPEIPVQSSE